MTQTGMRGIGELRALMNGPVITPGDADFDNRRRVWNAQTDRHPSVIARCASAADVAAAVGFARERQLEIDQQLANDPGGTRWRRQLPRLVDMYCEEVGVPGPRLRRTR